MSENEDHHPAQSPPPGPSLPLVARRVLSRDAFKEGRTLVNTEAGMSLKRGSWCPAGHSRVQAEVLEVSGQLDGLGRGADCWPALPAEVTATSWTKQAPLEG